MEKGLLEYGIAGIFILVLLMGMKKLYEDNKKEIKSIHEEHSKERQQTQLNVINEFKKLFDEVKEDKQDLKEITKGYSEDTKNVSKVLEGFKSIFDKK